MGRPKGSKNAVKAGEPWNVPQGTIDQEAEVEEALKVVESGVKLPSVEKPKLEPLGPNQAYFEAPDGTIVIGEDSRNEIWWRKGNNGKGMLINRKR